MLTNLNDMLFARGLTDIDRRSIGEDTYKGMDKALQEGTLEKIDEFNRQLRNATGTVDRDLGTAMDNAVTQANRLKGAFHEAIEDGVMRPLDNGDPKNFPIAFPNKALILVGSAKWHAASKETSINANILDNARFTMINGSGYDNDTSPNYWIAIGY